MKNKSIINVNNTIDASREPQISKTSDFDKSQWKYRCNFCSEMRISGPSDSTSLLGDVLVGQSLKILWRIVCVFVLFSFCHCSVCSSIMASAYPYGGCLQTCLKDKAVLIKTMLYPYSNYLFTCRFYLVIMTFPLLRILKCPFHLHLSEIYLTE